MIVFRKTMERALVAQQERHVAERAKVFEQFGSALVRSEALQREMSAWVANKAENITPEQMAQMFYAQDDSWQAAFFNVMQDQVQAHHDAMPPRGHNEFRLSPGVPAGETQWCYMADKLDDSGFETIQAMFEHAQWSRAKANGPAQ